tara:strand:+ start:4077 stop:5186 length:1110 start_codon:yes stop_codon:yes gene_type:complete
MATIFKNFMNNDVATTRTLLHEAVPVTGTIPSGTYTAEANIKNYAHGMFQSVFDYPFLSSSANHIFDITVGFASDSNLSKSAPNTEAQQAKKINIYNQMAQMLVGYDETGAIRNFDKDGDLSGGTKLKEVFFINFARLLNKDEIKKGSVELKFMTGSEIPVRNRMETAFILTINDSGSLTDYRQNSPAGEYGFLYTTTGSAVGLIYYQAGIAVITGSIYGGHLNAASTGKGLFGPPASGSYSTTATSDIHTNSSSYECYMTGVAGSISGACDGVRNTLQSLSFNNTTELNSTIYFCRASHNEYNYSSNPSYLNSSKLVVKNKSSDMPVSYITSVGLYSADNELLAVAKLSEPLKKTPTNELTLRVRLDY